MDDDLLQIGVFSRLSRISVRMLRHYAEHGLLIPAWVDPASGYRYYHADQLRVAGRITALRDIGLPVAEMAAMLDSFSDSDRLSARLAEHRGRLHQQLGQATGRLAELDRLIRTVEAPEMTIEIRTLTLPAMTVAAVRDVIPNYAAEPLLWERLMPQVMTSGVAPGELGGATFYDADYHDTDVDVEVWMQVQTAFEAHPPVTCRRVPEQPIVQATLYGSYAGMAEVSAALGGYIAEHGLTTGPMFNIYRVSPAQDPNPEHWVTEVCLPIIKS